MATVQKILPPKTAILNQNNITLADLSPSPQKTFAEYAWEYMWQEI